MSSTAKARIHLLQNDLTYQAVYQRLNRSVFSKAPSSCILFCCKDSANRAKNQILFEFFRDEAYLRPVKVKDKHFPSNLQGFERKTAKRLNSLRGTRRFAKPSQVNGSNVIALPWR